MKQKIYLESMPLDEALKRLEERLHREGLDGPLSSETVSVVDSHGRITAEAVSAKLSSPFYHSAAMVMPCASARPSGPLKESPKD
jgi:putative molybdopterin biosynthesis protein